VIAPHRHTTDLPPGRPPAARRVPLVAPGALIGQIDAIAWSPDAARLAVLGEHRVVLWEDGGPPSQLGFARTAGVEVRADGTVVLLGDPAAARELVRCRIGAWRYPIERCEPLVTPPR